VWQRRRYVGPIAPQQTAIRETPLRRSLQDRVVRLDNAVHAGARRDRSAITLIVLHCTVGGHAKGSIEYLNNTRDKSASYHYVIDRDGLIYRMCPPERVAYHAGDSDWPNPRPYPNKTSVNPYSLGIAWANWNDGEALTAEQEESGLWLCGVFVERGVSIERVVGHYEVSPGRKTDPEFAVDMNVWRDKLTYYLARGSLE
jgi:N-acetylmuramoyl-L-alanine amidase